MKKKGPGRPSERQEEIPVLIDYLKQFRKEVKTDFLTTHSLSTFLDVDRSLVQADVKLLVRHHHLRPVQSVSSFRYTIEGKALTKRFGSEHGKSVVYQMQGDEFKEEQKVIRRRKKAKK